jgi:arylformamidase
MSKLTPARLGKVVILAMLSVLGFSACQITPLTLPFQPSASENSTATATPQPAPAGTPTSTATPLPTKQVYQGIPYLKEDGVDPDLLSLDIYTPASYGAHPVIVMIHGGSWRSGNKGSGSVTAAKPQFFTNNGFVFVSINYRLSPLVIYPEHVEDVAAALAWVYQHISDYGGDPGQLYVMGHSAGAQLAALVATDDRYLAIYDMKPSDLSGVILLDAAGLDIPGTMSPSLSFMYTTAFGNDPETWKEASPVYYVAPEKGIPPFLVCYTFQVVPFTQSSQEFASLLAYAGVKVWSYAAENKTHNSISDDIGTPYDPVTSRIMLFLEETLPRTRLGAVIWQ